MPDNRTQRNFTDAESRIMPVPGGREFQQASTARRWLFSVNYRIASPKSLLYESGCLS